MGGINGKTLLLALLAFALLLHGCAGPSGGGPAGGQDAGEGQQELLNPRDKIYLDLKSEGIGVNSIEVTADKISVTYLQPLDESQEAVYATWAHIFGAVINNAAGDGALKEIEILCNFEDGEKIRVSAEPSLAKGFLEGEISAWDFLYGLDMEPLTEGPQIWTGG